MSAGNWAPPVCLRCGNLATRVNRLIGGAYCAPCDDFITKADPKIEAAYNRRLAERKRKEAES